MLTDAQIEALRAVPGFANSPTGFIAPDGALDYFKRKIVDNLARRCDLSRTVLLDAGCHEGWNLLAFLLAGGRFAIGVDMNAEALRVAAEFARILGLTDRALFCHGSVTRLPIADRSVDVACCVEVLEHLDGGADAALSELNRVARRIVWVTTPNKLCPVVAHDTRLPLAHWLPPHRRGGYARLFGREADDERNTFVTPFQVLRGLADFRLDSGFAGFESFAAFEAFFPHYLPYMGPGVAGIRDLGRAKRLAFGLSYGLLRHRSFYVLPSLTGLFLRRDAAS
ncbi:MAG: class I SAM-dependent methyltransferase [Planctomycetes bacterium]|nr:class I SAM-dependent methyltransferase [Planctomycetota bacterium]